MSTFDRCSIAFDDTGRGKLKDGQKVISEINYFLYYDKVVEDNHDMEQKFEGLPDVYGQFETVDSIPALKKQGQYTLCLQSKLELEMKITFIYQPGVNTVSCDFTVVDDSVKKFYNLLS